MNKDRQEFQDAAHKFQRDKVVEPKTFFEASPLNSWRGSGPFLERIGFYPLLEWWWWAMAIVWWVLP